MSLIRVECESCSTALQVRRELAGQQGRCPVCGALIDIPPSRLAAAAPDSPSPQAAAPPPASSAAPLATNAQPANASPPAPMALSQAGAPEMLAEIHRRKKSAVMVVFETPADGSYAINRKPEAMVRCYRTPDMNDAQLMQVLEQLGHMSQGMRNQKGGVGLQPEGAPLPYELKGDRLGMTLEDFKAKYARKVSGMTLPYCSDSSPGQPNSTLWSEPWHVAAGLVNARVELPSENNSPTIAGLKTDLFLYHFVDGRLFRMTVLFDTEAFHLIHNALVQKQGPPQRENKERMEIAWDNGVSTIKLTRGTMRPKKASTLLYIHNLLQKSAEGRAPRREADL